MRAGDKMHITPGMDYRPGSKTLCGRDADQVLAYSQHYATQKARRQETGHICDRCLTRTLTPGQETEPCN